MSSSSDQQNRIWWGLILFAAVVAATGFGIPFMYDDSFHILNIDYLINGSGAFSLQDVHSWLYRPVLSAMYLLEHRVLGFSAGGMRVVNILLHLLNVFLLVRISRRIFRDSPAVDRGVLIGAALFMLHPVPWHSVLYVSARSTVLCCTFIFTTIFVYSFDRPKRFWFVLPALLAVLTKELGLLAIPMALILNADRFREDWNHLKANGTRFVLAGVAVAALVGFIAFQRQKVFIDFWGILTGRNDYPHVWINYVASQPRAMITYVSLFFFPINWAFIHDVPLSLGFSAGDGLTALVILVIAALALLGLKKKKADLSVGIIIALSFAPEFFYPRELIAIEQRCYLGFAFACMLVGVMLSRVNLTVTKQRVLAGFLIVLAVLTLHRVYVYQSYAGVRAHDSSLYPDHYIFAEIDASDLIANRENKEAIALLEPLIGRLNQDAPVSAWFRHARDDLYTYLITAYINDQQFAKADALIEDCYSEKMPPTKCDLFKAQKLIATRDFQGAIAILEKLRAQSSDRIVEFELVRAYLSGEQPDKGLSLGKTFLQKRPDDVELLKLIMSYYAYAHLNDDAAALLRQVLAWDQSAGITGAAVESTQGMLAVLQIVK